MNTNSRNVTYSTVGDYQLPNLTLNQPRKPLGKYGRLRRTYLMNHRTVLYNTMLLNGSLYPHLMEVEQTAESQMQQTMQGLLKLSLIHIWKPVVEREKGWFCENRECRFVLWKDNAFFKRLGKRLDAHVADKLLRDGRCLFYTSFSSSSAWQFMPC